MNEWKDLIPNNIKQNRGLINAWKLGHLQGVKITKDKASKLFHIGYNNKLNFKRLEKFLERVGEQK